MIRLARPRSFPGVWTLVHEDPRARIGAFVIVFGLLTAIALLLAPPAVVTYESGVVADRSVRAPRSVSYLSEVLTTIERDKAASAVPRQFSRDPAVAANETTKLAATVAAVTRVRSDATVPRDQKVVQVSRNGDTQISTLTAAELVDMTQAEWEAVARDVERLLGAIYTTGIRDEQLETARAEIPKTLPAGWTDRQKRVATALVADHVKVNETFDQIATTTQQSSARANVQPVQVQVAAGEVVVREGQVVTPQDVEKLRALGLASAGLDLKGVVGLILWAFLIAGVLALFADRYAQEAWSDDRRLVLTGMSLVVLTLTARVLIPGQLAVYAAPFAAIAMMLTILVGGRTALATQIAGALHAGMMSGQVELVAYVLVPALLGMAAVRRATTAREFVAGALYVVGGNLGVIGAFLLVGRATDVVGLLQLGGAALAGGIASGVFAFGGMVLLGHLFRITTVFELRELADPNHPLLRQLLLRTPGTYHHSLLVANLAERAAEAVGADPLVARVGAYYHDIGKMRNPTAFIENQTGFNPHDELDPVVSAGIIAAHVRDGLALAERYRLPERIREIIPGHHGTSLVTFFYRKAQDRGEAPDEARFRHSGPRPRSKEAGIVMMADGVEASVRSLEEKTPDTIRVMVDKIIGEKIADHQLDECDLTLRDVQRIRDAFIELLAGVYHERIPYPEDRIARFPPAASG
ncbi:MAG TPA: HDIG domain-containing protein [Candidatus Limnocylindria bacterium]|nr:HDIG domain-containing protein [Candidatus Limnocylindria bacterium]